MPYTPRSWDEGAPRGAAFPRRYPMVVYDVHDGDTVKAFLDQGGDNWWRINVRLHGCAARELTDPGGPEARGALREMLSPIMPLTVPDMFDPHWQADCESLSWDKYAGRIQARIWMPSWNIDVSTMLIKTGWAVAWDGRGTQPKPAWPRVVPA